MSYWLISVNTLTQCTEIGLAFISSIEPPLCNDCCNVVYTETQTSFISVDGEGMHKNSSIMHSSVRQCITKGFLSRILKIESSSKGCLFEWCLAKHEQVEIHQFSYKMAAGKLLWLPSIKKGKLYPSRMVGKCDPSLHLSSSIERRSIPKLATGSSPFAESTPPFFSCNHKRKQSVSET